MSSLPRVTAAALLLLASRATAEGNRFEPRSLGLLPAPAAEASCDGPDPAEPEAVVHESDGIRITRSAGPGGEFRLRRQLPDVNAEGPPAPQCHAWRADLNGDGVPDFLVTERRAGNGLAGSTGYRILLSSRGGYREYGMTGYEPDPAGLRILAGRPVLLVNHLVSVQEVAGFRFPPGPTPELPVKAVCPTPLSEDCPVPYESQLIQEDLFFDVVLAVGFSGSRVELAIDPARPLPSIQLACKWVPGCGGSETRLLTAEQRRAVLSSRQHDIMGHPVLEHFPETPGR
jgi:hypothetical protein